VLLEEIIIIALAKVELEGFEVLSIMTA